MRTRELTYEDERLSVRLIIGEATVLAGMKRTLLAGRAQNYLNVALGTTLSEDKDAESDTSKDVESEVEENAKESAIFDSVTVAARTLLARYLYPDLLAAVVEAEGLDAEMDVDTFLALPQALTDAWQNLVYELSPDWYPFDRGEKKGKDADDDGDAEKKARSASASGAG